MYQPDTAARLREGVGPVIWCVEASPVALHPCAGGAGFGGHRVYMTTMPLAPGSSPDARAARVAFVPRGKVAARTSVAERRASRLARLALSRITSRWAPPSRCLRVA